MKITCTDGRLAEQRTEALIILAFDDGPLLPTGHGPLHRRLARMLRTWTEERDFKATRNTVALLPTWETLPAGHLLLVGLGKRAHFSTAVLEQAVASAVRKGTQHAIREFSISAGVSKRNFPMDRRRFVTSCVAAGHIGQYAYRSSKGKRAQRTPSLVITDAGDDLRGLRAAARSGREIGEALCRIRDLANQPGNEATPTRVARTARALAREHGLQCTVWGKRELEREKCGAILAVSRGSHEDGKLITLTYRGGARSGPPIVLVGKTITFDTGGISLKPPKSMEWMRYDKCGGMAVLAAMCMVARLKPRRKVIGILAAAENMPGQAAVKPGDVITAHGGKTIEVLNTDAEGRLVLADALSVAGRYKPRAIVDIATLTGAVIVALGKEVSGLMSNDEDLVNELTRAGEAAGDPVWRLPLLPSFAEALTSPFADLKNLGGPGAGSSVAAAFLQAFVPAGVPWAHLDIAGTAWIETAAPYAAPGATLSGARLLVEWIMNSSK